MNQGDTQVRISISFYNNSGGGFQVTKETTINPLSLGSTAKMLERIDTFFKELEQFAKAKP